MRNYKGLDKVPVGPLGIISLQSSKELGSKVNDWLVKWRSDYVKNNEGQVTFPCYQRNTFLVDFDCYRFGSGEGKAVINDSVRGYDIFIIADVCNYSCTYKMFGMECPMGPDDHFQDIKRVISAIGGKARRINVFMPYLYSGRQHKRMVRESLDCAVALQELACLGVENVITFDAHDPRVQNAIPLKGFENVFPTYQIIKALVRSQKDLNIDKSNMMVISPDEGGIGRNLYYASMLKLNLGLFYKRRDYSKIVNGRNPIVAHEFLGESVEGKDVLIVDDMIATGDSIMEIAEELKRRKANRIYVAVTFALFTEGIERFDECCKKGIITKLFSTNLTYRRPELLKSSWYVDVDMSKFIAYLVDTLNHDLSLSELMDPSKKIQQLLVKHID